MNATALAVPVVRCRLENGATVIVRPDPTLGVVVVNAWHRVGSMHDPVGRSGLAHLVEHLVFASSETGAPDAGRSANATTAFERTNFVDAGPPELLEALLSRVASRIRRGSDGLDAATLERHRSIVLEEIRQREDAAHFGSGLRRGLRLLFGADHPFGKPALGSPEEISGIGFPDVAKFVEEHYGSAGLIVSVVGPVEAERAFDLAGRQLAGLPGSNWRTRAIPAVSSSRGREDVDEGQPTSMLRYTFGLPSDGDRLDTAGGVAIAALAGAPWTVFGSSSGSGLGVLGAAATHIRCAAGPSVGLLKLAFTATSKLPGLERAVRDRLALLAAVGPDEDVLVAAKARRVKEHLALMSGARSCAEELCQQQAWHGNPALINEGVGRLRAVTGEQVREVVASWQNQVAVVAFHAAQPLDQSWIA